MTLLDQETWRRLDPGAARLPRRTTMWIALALIAMGVLLAAVIMVRHSGIIWPHFTDGDEWGGHGSGSNFETLEVSHSVVLRNDGWTEVTVIDIGRDGPGMMLLGSNGTFPAVIQPGDSIEIEVRYQITDCAAVSNEPWPMPVRVQRPWGSITAYVSMPNYSNPPPELTQYSYTGADPYATQWQRELATRACNPEPYAPPEDDGIDAAG